MRHAHLITLTITTSNEAFDDCEHGEVARILRRLARDIGDGSMPLDMPPGQVCGYEESAGDGKMLTDINGNAVGRIHIQRDD